MYLFSKRINIKMKIFFSTSNCKILFLIILIVCRKNLSQSGCTDCKIIKTKMKKLFFGGVPKLLSMF
jgi:hypothetical protein